MSVEVAVIAVIGTTVAVLAGCVAGVLAARASAAARSALWRSVLALFWLVPAACVAGTLLSAEAPGVTVFVPSQWRAPLPLAAAPETIADLPADTVGATPHDSPAPQPAAAARQLSPPSPLAWVFALWMAGALGAALTFVRDTIAARSLARSATPMEAGGLAAPVQDWAQRIGLGRPPSTAQSDAVATPTVVGWLRPVLLLPAGHAPELPAQEAVLVHELAHIRRRDLLFQHLARLTRCLWWWHPLAWVVVAKLLGSAEEACDDWAVALTGDRRGYADAVVRWAEVARPAGALGCGVKGGALVRRVGRILEGARVPTLRIPRSTLAALVVALVLVGCLFASVRIRAVADAEGQPVGRYVGSSDTAFRLPRETTSIRGRVFLPDGVTPAVGARVTAERVYEQGEMSWHPPEVQPVRGLEGAPETADDGTFELTLSQVPHPITVTGPRAGQQLRGINYAWGRYVVRVHMPGYAPARFGPVEVESSVEVILQRGRLWRGTVTDYEGRPVSGIHVGAYWPSFRKAVRDTGEAAGAETGADGRFELGPLAPGEYDVWAKADDRAPASIIAAKLTDSAEGALHLRLQAPAEIRGRVVYLGTREPMQAVSVWLRATDTEARGHAESDADGRFVLEGLPAGHYELELWRQSFTRAKGHVRGYVTADGTWQITDADELVRATELARITVPVTLGEGQILERSFPVCDGGIVEGRVLSADGRPVPDADVSVCHAIRSNLPDYTPESFLKTHPISFRSTQAAKTDAEGRFRIEHLWPRHYCIEARDPADHYGVTEFFEVDDRATATTEVTITDATSRPFPEVPDALRDEVWR